MNQCKSIVCRPCYGRGCVHCDYSGRQIVVRGINGITERDAIKTVLVLAAIIVTIAALCSL